MKRAHQHQAHMPVGEALSHKLMVTPAMARQFIAHARQVRVDLPVGYFHVRMETYYRDMMAGRWFLKRSDPLAFDDDGHLVNGRHRMEALSRCPDSIGALPFAVVGNYTERELTHTDDQKIRTIADAMLKPRRVTSVATMVWDAIYSGNQHPSKEELLPFVERVEPFLRVIEEAIGGRTRRYWTTSPVLTAVVVIGLENGEDSVEFLHAVEQLACVTSPDVEEQRKLCNSVMGLRGQFESTRGLKLSRLDVLARSVQAFDLERANLGRVQVRNRDIYIDRVAAQFKDLTTKLRELKREEKRGKGGTRTRATREPMMRPVQPKTDSPFRNRAGTATGASRPLGAHGGAS